MMSAGDFNGDGYADFLTISDRMQLFPGGPSGPSETPMDISELVSNSAGFVGDINGDGYQDILSMPVAPPVVETPNLPMLVLYGNPEGRLDFHVERIADPRDGTETLNRSYVGYRHRWGDLNEDGYMDAVVSVPNGVYLYYGSAAGYTRIVQPRTTEVGLFGGIRGTFGGYTAHPADVDGDGHAEVMIGSVLAPADEETRRNGTGRVYVYTRDPRTGLSNTAAALTFGPPPGSFGFGSVGAPGDLNADGYDDVVVGASPNPARSDATEFLYVYHGGHAAWWRAPVARIEHPYAFERSE